ncbi:hypothetical protein UFOVP228_80 [uncultured Caudovirales phage]|uniref:Uncharacterized protein n=1 Tax=uncultured Caudovirales phage TaxID=2100421 RepID=A0A6J5T869_9CAUD|nr:hypothetical protein UFOVP47_22 [uncultured Caudovirales phage]CAB5219505.1 hypothetical protein UFOVP228_80 [uncultured Caudovirales phage]
MTTSGTTAFTLDLLEVVEEAFERCGSEPRTGYDLRTARRSINLLFADWANRGMNMWTMDAGSVALVAGQPTYLLPADTIDVLDCTIRFNDGVTLTQYDRPLSRVSQAVYTTIPNKLIQGVPNQMTINRLVDAPTITLFPVPQDSTAKLIVWRLRRIQDVTGGTDTNDIPFRLLPAFTSGLAYYLSFKIPGALDRSQMLKAVYDEDFQRASDEDREKAPVRFIPRIGRI